MQTQHKMFTFVSLAVAQRIQKKHQKIQILRDKILVLVVISHNRFLNRSNFIFL